MKNAAKHQKTSKIRGLMLQIVGLIMIKHEHMVLMTTASCTLCVPLCCRFGRGKQCFIRLHTVVKYNCERRKKDYKDVLLSPPLSIYMPSGHVLCCAFSTLSLQLGLGKSRLNHKASSHLYLSSR